jgi:hypothetical protein
MDGELSVNIMVLQSAAAMAELTFASWNDHLLNAIYNMEGTKKIVFDVL